MSELKLALRSLRRAPLFALPVVLTLALAIGAACAMFSVLWALVLRPLPYPRADELVSVFGTKPGRGPLWVSLADLRDFEAQAPSLQSAAGYRFRTFTLDTRAIDLPVVEVAMVTERFFETLGVPAPELRPGARGVVVTERAARARSVRSGQSLRLNDEPYRVLGVLPPSFEFAADGRTPALFIALEGYEGRGVRAASAIGRLRSMTTLAQLQRELATVAARLAAEYPESNAHWSAGAEDLHRSLTRDRRQPLALLMAAVGSLFLIGLFNVVNLVLGRAASRLRDSAVRMGLGATVSREIGRHFAEGIVLAVVGGALGVAFGGLLLTAAQRFLAAQPVRAAIGAVHFGWPSLAFGAALSALTVAACALAPAGLFRGLDVHRVLQLGASALRLSGRSPRDLLVVVEVALSAVLLLGSGLFLRSLFALLAVDPGFVAQGVITFGIGLPEARYQTEEKQLAFFEMLLGRLRLLPGVEVASGVYGLPMSPAKAGTWVQREGAQGESDERPRAALAFAAPGYFEALRIPLLAGRTFAESDGFDAPPVCVISAALARTQFPGEDPVGKRVVVAAGGDRFPQGTAWTVVGVAGDVQQDDLSSAPRPQVYLPFKQVPGETLQITLRTKGPGDESVDEGSSDLSCRGNGQ
jgi:putative ABC transport system permease protein